MRIAALGNLPRSVRAFGAVTPAQADLGQPVLVRVLDTLDAVREAMARAEIRGHSASVLDTWRAKLAHLEARYDQLLGRYDELEPDGFNRWLEDARLLQEDAAQLAQHVKQALAADAPRKNTRIALWAVGAVALTGGIVYLLSRYRR